MPTLTLGRDPYQNFINLLAVMLFPHDPHAMAALPKAVDPRHPVAVLAKDKYLEGWEHGTAAGDVLIVVRIIAEHHPDVEPSIERAALIVEQGVQPLRRAKGRKFPRHERKIREAFYHYRAVAHLWAAWVFLGRFDMLEVDGVMDMGLLLAVAEDMRIFGEGHLMPRRKQEHLLRAAESWKPPPDLDLSGYSVSWPPLAPAALEVLRGYRARPR